MENSTISMTFSPSTESTPDTRMPQVKLTSDARDDFIRLGGAAQKMVAQGLRKLAAGDAKRGESLGARAGSDLTSYRKLVVAKKQYRIIYKVHADGDVSVVYVIGKRSDNEAYEIAAARLNRLDSRFAAELKNILDRIQHLSD